MGIPVTVDSDDLETLLFNAAVVKDIESALKARTRDPFTKQHLGLLTEAQERVEKLWRGALRAKSDADNAQPLPPLSKSQLHWLGDLEEREYLEIPSIIASDIAFLRKHNLVEVAPVKSAVFWGSGLPLYHDLAMYHIRITKRGLTLLKNEAARDTN